MKRVFRRIGMFTENKFLLVLILCLVLIVGAVFGASQIKMETGLETFLDTDSDIYKDYNRFTDNFGNDMIIVMVKGEQIEDLVHPENIKSMDAIEAEMGANENVISVQSPALFIRQQLDQEPGPPIPALPEGLTLEEILAVVYDSETDNIRIELAQLLPDEQHALITIILEGGLEGDELKELVEETERVTYGAGFSEDEAVLAGGVVVDIAIESKLGKNMGIMFGGAILLLFIILAIIFKVRGFFPWRWLPLGVVIIGTIYTLGLMGTFSIPLTMISMSVFPILIGLGIDYGIQFHNRYDEEAFRGRSVGDAIIESITHIGPAVGIALVAGCLGFAALFASPIPMIQDFGLMLIIGVICSYIVAIFPLMAILYWHDRRHNGAPKAKSKETKTQLKEKGPGFIERGLIRLAPVMIKHPFIIVPIAIALTIGGISVDSRIETSTNQADFVDQSIDEIANTNTLEEIIGGLGSFNVLIESDNVATPEVLQWMADVEEMASTNHEKIVSTESIAQLVMQENNGEIPNDSSQIKDILAGLPGQLVGNLINNDHSASNLILTIAPLSHDEEGDLKDELEKYIEEQPESAKAVLTGYPVIGVELVKSVSTEGRNELTTIGTLLIFGALLVLFRFRPLRALMATLPIVLIIGWAALFMYIAEVDFTPATATFGALIMGIGVEFTVLLMTRYYEEREKGEGIKEAMTTAMTKIGRAVSVSAFTTIGGFAALLMAMDFPILQDFGIVTMINVFFALVASLFVLPSIIVWIDTKLEKYRIARFL